jgi:hypothetical protein
VRYFKKKREDISWDEKKIISTYEQNLNIRKQWHEQQWNLPSATTFMFLNH